jgi:hypothetical protein
MGVRDLLLAAVEYQNITPVAIPHDPKLDGKVYVRVMTAGERAMFADIASAAQKDGRTINDYELVALCACESDGKPIFYTIDGDRIFFEDGLHAQLLKIDGRTVSAIARAALEVSGI